MTSEVIVALIGAAGVILAAVISAWVSRRQRATSRSQDDRRGERPVENTRRSVRTRLGLSAYDDGEENYARFYRLRDLPAEPRSFLREASPTEMRASFAALPPLEREAVATRIFVGRWIRWSATVKKVWESEGIYMVAVTHDDGEWFSLAFPPSRRAEIEAVREGDRLSFEGQVASTTGDGFLTLVRVHLLSNDHSAR